MANKSSESNLGDYAARHPLRMYTGMLALGTMIGAGLMASKRRSDYNNDPLHKLLDKLSGD